jgi:quercetin dioxygenase-like cupin family protein
MRQSSRARTIFLNRTHFMHHISFNTIPWESKAKGQRQRAHQENGKQIRIMEITQEFVEPDWCTRGHNGYVLEGTLELSFPDKTLVYQPGDAFMIPVGDSHKHKARALSPLARFVMVEDVE